MGTTTKNCEECANHRAVYGNELACSFGHSPRWFSPKGTLDQNYGWKCKCNEFREMRHSLDLRINDSEVSAGDTALCWRCGREHDEAGYPKCACTGP